MGQGMLAQGFGAGYPEHLGSSIPSMEWFSLESMVNLGCRARGIADTITHSK